MKNPKSKGKSGSNESDVKPWKVYVSGFLDWPASENEAQGFDRWQCNKNPSGRLLIGKWWNGGAKPDATAGLLARKLKAIKKTAGGRPVEWTFDVLPVVWGIGKTIPARKYDVVINIGLGVYKKGLKTIFIEQGAFNRRNGQADAVGKVPGRKGGPPVKIDEKGGKKLAASKKAPTGVKAAAGKVGAYTVEVKKARKTNNYICNETHFLMLKQVRPKKRLRRAFFIHIAKPARIADYQALAGVLAKTISKLVVQ